MKSDSLDQYLESVFNTMNDGMVIISPNGIIEMVNQSFERMTGYRAEEVVGRPCTLLSCDACELAIKSEKGRKWWCALFHPDHGGMKRCRCNYLRKDGTHIPVLKNASVLRDENGNPRGAVETLTDISELNRLDMEVSALSRQLEASDGFHGIIGVSPVMQQTFAIIEKAAKSDSPVIIFGESGTGKDLVARAIHICGARSRKPYVQFNCAALNESLLESELFGHAKGAFTGAYRDRVGRFEAAHGGDIFLDEIGDIPMSTQVRLLRILEHKQFERVGDNRPVSVDVRIISATNKDLEEMIRHRQFREDLFYRINVIPIHLPPLRQRLEDVPVLVNAFIRRLQESTGKGILGLTRETLDMFIRYEWPGNVRELKGALEYAFVVSEGGLIQPRHLPPKITSEFEGGAMAAPAADPEAPPRDLSEKNALVEALRRSGGNQSQAARLLGVNRVTVYNRMKRYGIELNKVMKA